MSFYLNRYYHIDNMGKEDFMCSSLDCWEQFLYFILREKTDKYKFAFCDDINISFLMGEGKREVGLYSLRMYKDLFSIRKYDKPNKPDEIINKILLENKIAVVKPYFNLLEPYCWYNGDIEKKYIQHNLGIVGQDEDDYFFIDSPSVFRKGKIRPYDQKRNIYRMNKEYFLRICREFCEIRDISVIEKNLKYINKLSQIIKIIINNYHTETEKETRYIGRKALILLMEMLQKKEEEQCSFFIHHFEAHMVYSKHLILRWCMEEDKEHYFESIKVLDILISNLRKFVVLIAESGDKTLFYYRQKIIELINEWLNLEDRLILTLEKISY
ncbi:MAG: hypothetical protein HFI05_09375 [Lachnospiraceae bacterium]|jgi:hypothetical protein|nr:hypothetical protein [Lachnospiraceae bacterium]